MVFKMGKQVDLDGQKIGGRFKNLVEVRNWETLHDEVRDRFVPIEDYDEKQYWWMTMLDVDSVTTEDSVDEFEG